MPTAWRQGDLLRPEDAITLGLIEPSQRNTHRVLVVSHSCDISNEAAVEPTIELMLGQVIPEGAANARNGHSIRRLDLGAEIGAEIEWAQYGILDRRTIDKSRLLDFEPWPALRYPMDQRRVLQRWLAQRYSRSEFPDAFVDWLQRSGVDSRFEKFGKEFSTSLVGIYFDLDDDSERNNPTSPYSLGINLVYDASNADHAANAEHARAKLAGIFDRRCRKEGSWHWIELIYCDAVSEQVFSLRAARSFRRWRFEHRSVSGEPVDPAE